MEDLLASALKPYQQRANLGDGYLDQFQRICKVASWLASNEPNETSLQDTLKIFEHLRRSEEKPTLAAEFELNRIQIVRYADRFGYESFYDQQSQLEREVSNNGSLLEGFLGEGEQSDVSTFFLSDASDDCFLEADEYLRQVEGTKRLLEKVLTSVSERASKDQPRRVGGAIAALSRFGHGLFSRSNFDALASIHHEVAENALSHGTYSRLNQRGWPNTNPAFGNTFHLQVRSLPHTKANQTRVEALHPNFSEHVKQVAKNTNKKNLTYWIFSYCDTGGGILNHMKQFGSSGAHDEEPISISQLIDRRMSTRNFSGSGFGLEKICQFTSQLAAFTFIDTKDSSFSYDGTTDSKDELPGRVDRGTMISIVINSGVSDAAPSN